MAMFEAWSVSQITQHIKALLDGDMALQDVWVIGEVSNYTRAASGHIYLTLKDAEAQLRGVMWRSWAARQTYLPQSGDQVMAHGYVSVYEAGGQYQLYLDAMQPMGVGQLYLEFEALKERLAEEGLFDESGKRALPPFPRCIGVVTSPTGAALRDILNVLSRRYPVARVILSPSLVQGVAAPAQIVEALACLNQRSDVEMIILARGGGSLEDLWAFNDESVARAIYASRLPVVSGVGHETDFTIADFVADLRAPTPSAAAELAVPDQFELLGQLAGYQGRLGQEMGELIAESRSQLERVEQALRFHSPQRALDQYKQRLDHVMQQGRAGMLQRLSLAREQLRGRALRLEGLSPLRALQRGYAIVRDERGTVVRSVSQVDAGDTVRVQVSDGEFEGTVRS